MLYNSIFVRKEQGDRGDHQRQYTKDKKVQRKHNITRGEAGSAYDIYDTAV
jgi:hypothetical protein